MSPLAQEILSKLGGKENLKELLNCMTRLRVVLNDESKLDEASLKKVEGILGVVKKGDQYQIIVGPGVADTLRKEMEGGGSVKESSSADALKAQMKEKYEVSFAGVLKKISGIFIPLIPAFIACGLLAGIVNLLRSEPIFASFVTTFPDLVQILFVFGNSIFFVMMILVGVTSAQVFGGSIAIGAALAGILNHPSLSSIQLFGENLSPGRGGILSVIAVVYLGSLLENSLKKVLKGALDLILNPLIVLTAMGLLALVVIQPMAGFLADAIGYSVSLSIEKGGALTGFLLAGLFLPLVMTGLHQALIPIHAQLIESTGMTLLFPILAMAGAGQVGASFAVYLKTKNSRLKKVARSALPVGLLGIGEPLIYGVTLPLGRPFLAACLGGALGGAVLGFFQVGSLSIGISGLPLALSIAGGKGLQYLAGVFTAYGAGFLFTYLAGFTDPEE